MKNDVLDNFIAAHPEDGYLYYHKPRYEVLLNLVKTYHFPNARILDIGNSKFSKILSTSLNSQVDELGFFKDTKRQHGNTYQFNLNRSQDKKHWRTDFGTYDIIVFAEVIEHLYTAPSLVLDYLYALLSDNGILIIQTPNATVLHKRIQLLLGHNPYMLIRETPRNPGHFREYTKKELLQYSLASGFQIEQFSYANYFDYRYTQSDSNTVKKVNYLSIYNYFYALCPGPFKPGITMVIKKHTK